MTEVAREQSLGRYLAVKNERAYGLLEMGGEPIFETGPTSSASWVKDYTEESLPEGYVHEVPADIPHGPTVVLSDNAIFLNTVTALRMLMLHPRVITSGELETRFLIGRGDSMATQQPSITDEEDVEEIIWRVQTTRRLLYMEALVSRLRELQNAVQEEESEGRGISVGSLQHFIEFLEENHALRCPAISVTPDRNIYASWKSGPDRVFSIHFLPEGKVRFVIFRPNNRHPGQTIRLSGIATVDVIINMAAPHGVLEWAQNERPNHTRF